MSKITPDTFAPATLGVPVENATQVNTNFQQLTEINGNLGPNNVEFISESITYTQVQDHAVSGGTMVAGTANLDYFNGVRYVFENIDADGSNKKEMADKNHNHLAVLTDGRGLRDLFRNPTSVVDWDTGVQIDTTFDVTDAATCNTSFLEAVPGASVSFFLPYQAYVLLTWQISWTSDAARLGEIQYDQNGVIDLERLPEPNTAVRLHVNGVEHNQWSTTRESRESMFAHPLDGHTVSSAGGSSPTYLLPPHAFRDRYKARYWSGHVFLEPLGKGFHTASLRVAAMRKVRQMRVRARSMKVLYFKA